MNKYFIALCFSYQLLIKKYEIFYSFLLLINSYDPCEHTEIDGPVSYPSVSGLSAV